MKLKQLAITGAAVALMTIASHAATNLLNAPGFEDLSPGPLGDGSDNDTWASFSDGQNNMIVTTDFARTGTQALKLGPHQANKFSNARQSESASFSSPGDIESQTFDISFWIYYDSSDAPAPTTGMGWQFLATNPNNVHRLDVGGTINLTDLTPDDWTEFSYQFTVPVTDPVPVDPNLITNRVNITFFLNGHVTGGDNGSFYVDDVNVSLIPEPSILGLLAFAPVLAFRRRRALGAAAVGS